jgi:hypothetical protein
LGREKTPSQLTLEKTLNTLWVELEEGEFPSSNIGDPSSLALLGMTLFGKGGSPFPTFPKVLKSFLGGVGGGHSPPPLMVMSNEVRHLRLFTF